MTIEEKIGQMLVFGWMDDRPGDSQTINKQARSLIEEHKVGGLILMTRNVKDPFHLRQLLDGMQVLASENGLPPLFVSIDQEGGHASRLRPPLFRETRSAWQLGEENSANAARLQAGNIGAELLEIGINWDFAPVLDVNNNPLNPVIGKRSYGDDARKVADLGAAAVHGFQDDVGVMACGKHFPGHGDTDVDSHAALPTIPHSMERLREVELLPFKAAIEAGVAAIMTAHIMFPALDPQLPATLSKEILRRILREELGYGGLIVTDCLEMKGIADNWSFDQSAMMAVEAGADLILCCHNPGPQKQICRSLVNAVKSGRISEERVDESLERIRRAKEKWLDPIIESRFSSPAALVSH
jgi:beta-N-acetylhexosaminidase